MSLGTQTEDMNFLRRAAELGLRDKGEENLRAAQSRAAAHLVRASGLDVSWTSSYGDPRGKPIWEETPR